MHFTIEMSNKGYPYLKKSRRPRNEQLEGRGLWVEIGPANSKYIQTAIETNEHAGYLVLIDEFGYYRMLVLTD